MEEPVSVLKGLLGASCSLPVSHNPLLAVGQPGLRLLLVRNADQCMCEGQKFLSQAPSKGLLR